MSVESTLKTGASILFDDDPLVNMAASGLYKGASYLGRAAKSGLERLRSTKEDAEKTENQPQLEEPSSGLGGKDWTWLKSMLSEISANISSLKTLGLEQQDIQEKSRLEHIEERTEDENKRTLLFGKLDNIINILKGGGFSQGTQKSGGLLGAFGGLMSIFPKLASAVRTGLTALKTFVQVVRSVASIARITELLGALRGFLSFLASWAPSARLAALLGWESALAAGPYVAGMAVLAGGAAVGADALEDTTELPEGPDALEQFMNSLPENEKQALIASGFSEKPQSVTDEAWKEINKTMKENGEFQKETFSNTIAADNSQKESENDYSARNMVPPARMETSADLSTVTSTPELQRDKQYAEESRRWNEEIQKTVEKLKAEGKNPNLDFLYNQKQINGVPNPNLEEYRFRTSNMAGNTANTPAPGSTETPGAGEAPQPDTDNTPKRISAVQDGRTRIYTREDGSKEIRTGGTRAWRNNNPGNVTWGSVARSMGAIGYDFAQGHKIAIFPTLAAGEKARSHLLFDNSMYKNLDLMSAIHKYAPPKDKYGNIINDTAAYQKAVLKAVGTNKRMVDYTPEEQQRILDAMRRVERFSEGKVHITPTPSQKLDSLSEAQKRNREINDQKGQGDNQVLVMPPPAMPPAAPAPAPVSGGNNQSQSAPNLYLDGSARAALDR